MKGADYQGPKVIARLDAVKIESAPHNVQPVPQTHHAPIWMKIAVRATWAHLANRHTFLNTAKNIFCLPIITPTVLLLPAGDGLLEVTLSAEEGILALPSSSIVCADGALEGSSVNFRGSLQAVNDALAGFFYLVRSHRVADSVIGVESTKRLTGIFSVLLLLLFLARMSWPISRPGTVGVYKLAFRRCRVLVSHVP